jgi:hypothetical protein
MVASTLQIDPAVQPVGLDLAEDLLGAWSPDPAGWLDLDSYGCEARPTTSYVAHSLEVPRPGGGFATARVLHPAWHVVLHHVAGSFREAIDAALAPGVFGYRRGAEAGRRYADDWRAFCRFVDEYGDAHQLLLLTDVSSFFESTRWDSAARAVSGLMDSDAAVAFLEMSRVFTRASVPCLPTGYADARMLANAVLAEAESAVDVPFARWVDDYRFFVESASEAQRVLDSLDAGLAAQGLKRNESKTRLLPAVEAIERHHKTLASVYHPDRDPVHVVAARLRDVFCDAVKDPVANRRQLRFVLPRLAEQRDSVAVDFALQELPNLPWEAPRLVQYLAAFADEHDLGPSVSHLLLEAASAGNAWLVCRLAPLAARLPLTAPVLRALDRTHRQYLGTPAWGLILRLLALNGSRGAVQRALAAPDCDVRAVMAAARDLGLSLPRSLCAAEPVLASLLESATAPLPRAETLL